MFNPNAIPNADEEPTQVGLPAGGFIDAYFDGKAGDEPVEIPIGDLEPFLVSPEESKDW